ncbi:NACHT, LRR and PYD domains-containing protein 12-like [Pseudophryne corroboree]|uniref:NACHT, LRR and PYD domains-containing protein 12-like n=1 Tax=Pseudophryne corroboree TaxID=495146 RepID=UPI0030812B70
MDTTSFISAQCERNRIPGDVLYEALQDLEQCDFKRFKDRLTDFSYGGRPPISRGRLENADYVAIKNLLIDVYGEEAALDVTIRVFKLINFVGLAENLRQKVTQHGAVRWVPSCILDQPERGSLPGTPALLYLPVNPVKMSSNTTLEDNRLMYVNYVRKKYHRIEDRNARIGEVVFLDKRYTNLLLIKSHRGEEERQHELTSSGQRHLQIMANRSSNEYSPTTIQDLFDSDDDETVPNAVVLQGPAGIGKTMTSQKIMLDWASGNLYIDKFHFVFYISCREVNSITGKISLAGYLSNYCGLTCPSDFLRSIFLNSEGILFIVDGFDELKLSSMNDTEVCDDPFQMVSGEIFLNSLFRKKLLRESSLIITTRPFSLMQLKNLVKNPRYVEILGFTGKDREEYFYCFFETKEQADLALSAIKDNDTLFTMCSVPITCWIVCTVIKQQLREGLGVVDCKTSTSIYLLYLKSLIKYHGRNSAQSVNTCIKRLCTLANKGVWDGRILFEEGDLRRHTVSMSELESVFLNENIFQRDVDTHTCYSFIHLSVQEFFAALYYVLGGSKFYYFLTRKKLKALLEASSSHPHLTLVVRFLFGFLSERKIGETLRSIGCTITFRAKPVLEKWLERSLSEHHNEILCCLYETQDKDYIRRMMSHIPHVNIEGLYHGGKRVQENIGAQALAYCLERSPEEHIITFRDYIIGPKARNVLSPALSKCSQIRFIGCRFPDNREDVYQDDSRLSGLLTPCRIQDLDLCHCKVTSACCDDLRILITESRSLLRLVLSVNDLQDSGVQRLCDGLRQPGCTLQELSLQCCGLTSSCCDDLRSVIITNRSLVTLDLALNFLQDCGIQALCEGLRHPDCSLQELRVWHCSLTPACCADLRSLITTNRSLVTLELGRNNLLDSGVKLLCKGLRHPDCTLQRLILCHCKMTSACCDDLRTVITESCSLLRLDLSVNDLQDSGVQRLCDGLRHPGCTLQELSLQCCGLTSSCCDDLRSVITTNRSLIHLDLSLNDLQDCGIKVLCEGLRHPECTLQKLTVWHCSLTPACCADLRSVITTNRSLITLELGRNNLLDSGVKLLCKGLKHPDCTLQRLTLRGCGLTSSCCDNLRSVLITNRSLISLDLRGNNLQDCEVKLRESVRPALRLLDLLY